MPETQLTLIQIDNYGPWTVTPSPRREADLQTLQSRLYADLCQFIGNRDGYVFFTRFDNMVAVTNGMDAEDHRRLQSSIGNRYPVTISLSTASASSPVDALVTATDALQRAGSAQDEDRREILRVGGLPADPSNLRAHIAHFDVVDATRTYTDTLNAFDTFIEIEHAYATLMRFMRTTYDGLSFFVGGDNIITVCAELDREAFEAAIEHVESAAHVSLQVGVGSGATAHQAGMAAKHALEVCRDRGRAVEIAGQVAERNT